MFFIFASTFARAFRSASLTAAVTRSASISGSSGSIAFGSIRSSTTSPPAVATTVTAPPPADAVAVSFAACSCSSAICCCIAWACFISSFMSKLMPLPGLGNCLRSSTANSFGSSTANSFGSSTANSFVSFVQLPRVEGALHQLENVLLADGLVRALVAASVLAELELDRQLAPRDLVERLAEQGRVLRVLGQLQVERGRLRELQRERVAREGRGVRLGERLPDRDRPLLHRRQDRAPPRLLQLAQVDVGRTLGNLRNGFGRNGRNSFHRSGRTSFEPLDAVGEGLAGKVGRGPRHLHERELEREPRVAALTHVVDGHRQQVDQPHHGGRRQLVRLLAQP